MPLGHNQAHTLAIRAQEEVSLRSPEGSPFQPQMGVTGNMSRTCLGREGLHGLVAVMIGRSSPVRECCGGPGNCHSGEVRAGEPVGVPCSVRVV
ncbi:hypothetical protein NDU88_003676 [Pleurodeles waltl]|uniref:Uncharacterized protein n=1 Tax=Pleurodeles waltl TaxID=8319 RepID=A0AAV7RI42_PLEWA|nr:hypothetical protein NDU88_003676 [Pleurodeles waltl]